MQVRSQAKRITFSEREQIHFHQLLDERFRHDTCIRESDLHGRICANLNEIYKTTRGK